MSISTTISRLTAYYRRNGFRSTGRRAALAVNRALFSHRMILFYCDLDGQSSRPTNLPTSLTVERKKSDAELDPRDLEEMTNFWNAELARRSIKDRFLRGASLWMIKSEGRLAGYGWTLQGSTIESHFFRLGSEDVHLFDYHVFPQYRGQGMNPLLVAEVLRNLAAECRGRAFIEAAEWNHAQLSSLRKTRFRLLGRAIKFTIFRRPIVCWDDNDVVNPNESGFENYTSPRPDQKASSVPDLRA